MRSAVASIRSLALCAAAAGAFPGCAAGIDPPELTEMVEIRTGLTFTFGSTEFCAPPNTSAANTPNCTTPIPNGFALVPPPVEVTLAPFAIDVHEVTNLQYLHCAEASDCTDLASYNGANTEQQDYYDTDRFANFPVNRVTWNQADAYCRSVGKRLPTEIEWERVARGNPEIGVDRPFAAEGIDDLSECQQNNGEGFAVNYCRGNTNFIEVTSSSRDFVMEGGQKIFGMMGNATEWTDTWASTEMGCKGPPACKQQRDCLPGDTFDKCVADSKDCPACANADDCYYMCEGQSLMTIVCTPFSDAEQPVQQSQVLPSGGSRKIIRGGGVIVNESGSCRMRSTRPNDKAGMFAIAVTETEQGVGFRCARSL